MSKDKSMLFQYTPYTVPLLLATLLGVVSAFMVWKRRDSKAENWFFLVMVAVAVWSFSNLVIVSSTSLGTKLLWFKILLVVSMFLPLAVFVFTLHYTGRKSRITNSLLIALGIIQLSIIPVLIFEPEIMLTNPHLETSGSFTQLEFTRGIGYLIYGSIAYAVTAAYIVMLFIKFLRSRNVYRKISFLLFTSISVMAVLSFISVVGLSPLPHYMLLPLSFLIFGSIGILGMTTRRFIHMLPIERVLSKFSSRFESLVPVARDFVVEEIDNGVIVLDNSGRIVDINSTAKEILRTERAVGRRIDEIIDIGVVHESDELLNSFREEELRELNDEIRVEYPEETKYYNVNISKLSTGGKNSGAVVLIHDITEQKERERKLREREYELEQQKRSLEQQNERLDKFASIVSHDLRNPLNVAQGYVDMEKENPSEEYVENIDDALGRMENIIDDALTLAREGKAVTETEEIVLADVVRESWENVETEDANLETKVGPETLIQGDRNRVLNVFENLFRNSVQHNEDAVTITVGENERGFYVEDDG
ncbi:MAG: histidine kinase N-terminal 7TM domain-containing protein, partial [Halobacteria archaeon]|nr:histidine kinase N-terminal 7TM domain-containing protein [Halobacteria archaeon]